MQKSLSTSTRTVIAGTVLCLLSLLCCAGEGIMPPEELAAPDVSASDGTYEGKVKVTWNSVEDAEFYEVWRNKEDDINRATKVMRTCCCYCYDFNAEAGTVYYYWVRSGNGDILSGYSDPDTGYSAELAELLPPRNVNASDGLYDYKIKVTWCSVAGAKEYEVWRSNDETMEHASALLRTGGTAYYDTTAVPGRTYFYWIRAVNGERFSDYSEPDSGWRACAEPPDTPTCVNATDGTYDQKIKVTWSTVCGADKYEVWRNTEDTSETAEKKTLTTCAAYYDTAVTPGTVYHYWIKARDGDQTSEFSEPDSGFAREVVTLDAPENLQASDGDFEDKVNVTWDEVANATSYDLYRGILSESCKASKIARIEETCYDDTTVEPATVYYYWVRSRNDAAESELSESDTGYAGTVPANCANLSIWYFEFTPDKMNPGEHPAMTAIKLVNAGPSCIGNPAAGLEIEFFLSLDDNLDEDDILIGNRTAEIELASGSTMLLRQDDRTGNSDIMIPEDIEEGTYNVFVSVEFGEDALYEDPDGALAMRTGTISITDDEDDEEEEEKCVPNDYDGDGKSDLAVYHEGSGMWFIRSADGDMIIFGERWGGHNMRPVQGDFNGDGECDLAVYHAPSGRWFVRTIDGDIIVWGEPWGGEGFSGSSGDFDNDGKSDMAVYHQASGSWFIRSVEGEIISWMQVWGGPGFMTVPGDYDHDGKSDIGVYDKAGGRWFVCDTEGSPLVWAMSWGGPDMTPVPGDYDGDGGSDMAVYGAECGGWYVGNSAGNPIVWGMMVGGKDYVPVPGDYDGDSRADVALYHELTGKWFITSADGEPIIWGDAWGGPHFDAVGSETP